MTTAPIAVAQPWLPSMTVFPAMELDALADQLRSSDIEVVEKIAPHGILAVQGGGAAAPPAVVVIRTTQEKAQALSSVSGGRFLVARNEPLTLAHAPHFGDHPIVQDPAVVRPLSTALSITIEVQSSGRPLANAQVYVFGRSSTIEGVTGSNGRVQLFLRHETQDTVASVAVIPASDAWSRHIHRPSLDPDSVNVIEVRPLAAAFADFPNSTLLGWGQRAMRLDQIPAGSRGRGVRIALVDSGACVMHRDLRHLKKGFDYPRNDPGSWTQDAIGHGSHCAGIIAASDESGFGIRGFAPEAEIHVLKVLPEGHVDDLIKALHYCMQNDIDIISLGIGAIGSAEPTGALAAILEPFLAKAKAMGIACIVAAGNTGGPIEYPGRSPSVLAVSAIGNLAEFPADSYHATLPVPPASPDGLFFPRFSCFGPEVGVTAPGVAVVSCVPENGFAAWDGTSMAASHIVGLAALVLAHNLDFQTAFAARNAARVDHLFGVLRQSAQRLALGDPSRTGAGLPNAVMALQPWAGSRPMGALTAGEQAEIARRIGEAIQNALSPAVSRSIASMIAAGSQPGPTANFGLAAAWPYQRF